jgi:hypothetical protein
MRHKSILFAICIMLLSQAFLTAQQGQGVGLEFTSAGKTFVFGEIAVFEIGVGAQAHLGDGSFSFVEDLMVGTRLGIVLPLAGPGRKISLGAEGWTAFSLGDIEYLEYVDLSLRIGLYQYINDQVRIEGLFFPLSISTREVDTGVDNWYLAATFMKAEVAVAFLF